MTTSSRTLVFVVACAAVLASGLATVDASAVDAAAAGERPAPSHTIPSDPDGRGIAQKFRSDAVLSRTGTFEGVDGGTYEQAPVMVTADDGTVFFGEDFDSACGYADRWDKAVRRLTMLGRLIEKSGRHVVFTIAPNKSSVDKSSLAGVAFPHGRCDRKGIEITERAMDSLEDSNYLPMRRQLAGEAAGGREVYWRVDTHWNTLGSTDFTTRLAKRLDPRLARRQSYARQPQTILVDLNFFGVLHDVYETGPSLVPTTPVRVSPVPGTVPYDPTAYVSVDHSWTTSPAHRTWRGQTLLVGDSYLYRALDSLMPLFRHGRFLWLDTTTMDDMVSEVARSRTVVLEVVQRYLPASILTTNDLRHKVRRAIAKYDARS